MSGAPFWVYLARLLIMAHESFLVTFNRFKEIFDILARQWERLL